MRAFNINEGLVQAIQESRETPASQCYSTDRRGTSSGHHWAFVRVVCSLPSCSTFTFKR
ncbi:hypothetical protein DPMN_189060 [Dreissena polymorpha]|uniref:Uncharacterized protein n=1 Tax=Dreissena polymorpha TaxID=45954 RepID=A0A9D4IBW3_DREPO|nr:hypothetical protein DPMN_189060 [Dreissena polymorpha]